jgi:hypothetical protein
MATFNDLINDVALNLSGYTMRQDRATHLTGTINSTDLTMEVHSVDNISKGLIEVDDELLWVDSFDRTAKTFSIAPYGRGYFGTTPTSHTVNTKVTIAPTFPILNIKRAINETILAVGNTLYGVSTITFDYNPAVTTYSLPADVQDILEVSYEDVGPTKEWYPVRRYRADKMASNTAFNSSISLSVYDAIPTSSTVKVTYSSDPAPFEYGSDDFESTTNLPLSCKDIIVLGAAYRLLSFVEAGRLTYSSPEADTQTGRIQFGSGTNVAKYIYALYQQRLQEEAFKLQSRYPVRVHYTR